MVIRRICWTVLAALCIWNVTYGAADSDQAIMSLPESGTPISRPHTRLCTVDIVKNFPFDAFGKISEQTYIAPKGCPGPWAKVVLDMDGVIDGAQYDRFGFIHLGQVELLRFTTPEPPHHAINWHVEKDVTSYSSLFSSQEMKKFTVQLDNSISKKLNGVYRLNATLTFYMPDKEFPAQPQPRLIKTISSGDAKQPYFSLVSPTAVEAATTLELPTNITRAILEIYATPHDLEEFWYLPGGNVAPYRELQIYIDGKLAGIAWPFPYIYTGGFNPHYWTPITAINALNIPPYSVDITPFAGILNKSSGAVNKHRISIKLNVMPSNWLIDANLLIDTDTKLETVTGQITRCNISPNAIVTELNNPVDLTKYKNIKVTRSLLCSGKVSTSQGEVITTLKQTFSLKNIFIPTSHQSHLFNHSLHQDVSSQVTTKRIRETDVKSIQSSYTFSLSPSVDDMNSNLPSPFSIDQSLKRIEKVINNGVSVINSITSQRINSSKLSTSLTGQTNSNYFSNATSFFRESGGRCYYIKLQAKDNKLVLQTIQNIPGSARIYKKISTIETCH
jgi:hypothetical protein